MVRHYRSEPTFPLLRQVNKADISLGFCNTTSYIGAYFSLTESSKQRQSRHYPWLLQHDELHNQKPTPLTDVHLLQYVESSEQSLSGVGYYNIMGN
jgi:hypothetical protein